MADQAYERGLEIREEMLGSEHGRAKVESADDFTRAVNNGVTREQIRELMIHAMPYCGIPAALDGIRHAAAVLDELGVA